MSASSSTIRMSCAMGNRTQIPGRRLVRFGSDDRPGLAGEYQPNPGAAPLAVFQHQFSLMIFHDLLDDGEAQSGALRARRHIGLGKPLTALLRQALAVILDDDHDFAVALGCGDANLP